MRPRYTLGLVAAIPLLLVACDSVPEGAVDAEPMAAPGEDPVVPVGPGGSLEIEAGDFYFEVLDGTPVTGDIEVTGVNVSGQFHDITFAGAAEGSEDPVEMEAGEEGEGTVKLFPGETTFWCTVPGHREAGMEATVTVYATEDEYEQAVEEGEVSWAGENAGENGGGEDEESLDMGDGADPAAGSSD